MTRRTPPAHLQQPAEPHRRREQPGGARARGRVRPAPRPRRALRRGLLGHPLLGREPVAGLAARHGRALRDPLHLQQEVRHDGLAAGRRHRARPRSSTSSPSSTSTTSPAPTTSSSTAPSRGSPATSRGRGRSCDVLKERRDAAVRPAQRDPRRPLLHARGDFLPVPQRHRADGAARDSRPTTSCGARPCRRRACLLHASAFRPRAARRGGVLRALRLLGHRRAPDRRRASAG